MNTIGKKNILFGLVYFLATLALGMFLALQLESHDPEWLQSAKRGLLKTAHVHGNMESLLNVVLGFLICRFGTPSQKLSLLASVLLIVGALFHSVMLYLGGLGLTAAVKLAPIGAISLVSGVALMIPIVARGLTSQE